MTSPRFQPYTKPYRRPTPPKTRARTMLLTQEYHHQEDHQESDLFLNPRPIPPPVDLGGWEMNPTWIKYLKEEPEDLGLTLEDLVSDPQAGPSNRLEDRWIHFPAEDPESPSLLTQKTKKKKDKTQARTMSKEERLTKIQTKIFYSIWGTMEERNDAPIYVEKELQSLELKYFRKPLKDVLKDSAKGISKGIWSANRQDFRFLYIIGKMIEEEIREKTFDFPHKLITRITVGKSHGLSTQKTKLAVRVYELFRPWPKTLDRFFDFTPKELGRLDDATFSMLKLRLIMEYTPDERDDFHPYI